MTFNYLGKNDVVQTYKERVDDLELAKYIRDFELGIIERAKREKFTGSIHPCIGQELNAVEICNQVTKGDWLLGNHRSHGLYLAWCHRMGLDLAEESKKLEAEIFNEEGGLCGGRGGSQHLFHPLGFATTGVQGGLGPFAVGLGLAMQRDGLNGRKVHVVWGDGTLGSGIAYEVINFADNLSLPVVFHVEDNGFAMSTVSYGVEIIPFNVKVKYYYRPRLCGHSINDDQRYRTREELKRAIDADELGGYRLMELFIWLRQ